MNTQLESYRHRTRALIFLLSSAIKCLYGDKRSLLVDHSFGDGFYCVFKEETDISADELQKIQNKMQFLQKKHGSIKIRKATSQDWHYLRAPRSYRTVRPPVLILDKHISPSYEFTSLNLNDLPAFRLQPYHRGFLLRVSGDRKEDTLSEFRDYPKLFSMMRESEAWGRILNISTVSDLNQQIMDKGFKRIIWIAEGLHEKKIAALADEISRNKNVRIIFVAGPSSSGKTTFTKRLAIQLGVNGLQSRLISMDDYFLDRTKITPQADGSLDFESVDCLDIENLCRDLKNLITGKPVRKRHYNFVQGKQEIFNETYQLNEGELLILEGIHGLNPLIIKNIPRDSYKRIYISALTQLNIDNHHPVSTSDARLIRRIVRDYRYRGYSADDTIERWNSVRYGELRNIFPFQEHADLMFNSAILYEMSILKRHAMPLLRKAKKNTVRERLITLLSLFQAIPERYVPGTSILREFIGKSYFTY